MLRLGALGVTLTDWWRAIRTYSLRKDSICDFSCTCAVAYQPFYRSTSIQLCVSFHRAYLKEWVYSGDDPSDEQGFAKFPELVQGPDNKSCFSKTGLREQAPPAPRPVGQLDALPREPLGPQGTASFLGNN